jgi:hypothetical protein
MSKNIALLPRRSGLSRAQFRDYYENNHAPLAIGYFPFTRYVRNHLADSEEVGFDTISEFWSEDLARLAALMETDVGALMRADEERFMDRPQIRSGAAEEYLLAGAPRTAESPALSKYAWLLRLSPGTTAAAVVADLTAWAHQLVDRRDAGCTRVTLDLVRPWGAAFPFDAVLWLWQAAPQVPATAAPRGVTVWQRLRVSAAETPPQVMAQALRARAGG